MHFILHILIRLRSIRLGSDLMDRLPFLIKFVRIVVATMIQITSITFLSGMKYDNAFMLQIYIYIINHYMAMET